jgi:hypothetical protein
MGLDSVVRINNQTFAWSSSVFLVDGQGVEGITSLDWEEKREVEVAYAARQDGRPVAWAGGGKYSVPSFKMRMLKDTFAVLQAYWAAGGSLGPGAGSYGDSIWSFQAQCVEPVIGSIPITAVAAPCRVLGKRETREQGIGTLVTELDIGCLQLIENGLPLWSVVRSLLGI